MTNWPWENFLPDEMADSETGEVEMSPAFMDRLQALRTRLGFPLPITSGYRTPAHDKRIGGAGVHPQGCAADISISGERAYLLVHTAMEMGFRGIGSHQRGPHDGRFVHIDDVHDASHPRPRIWTY